MSKYRIRSAEFAIGAFSIGQLPESALPEIAFVGRSNVGKSSLVNRLTGRKALARVSNTPGRTQQVNLFHIEALTPEDAVVQFSVTDLPGYGFAKFSKARREAMSRLIVDYIQQREQLQAVCLLNDSKRLPEEDELAIRSLCFEADVTLIVCPTKCDRLKKNELKKQLARISEAYGLEKTDLVETGKDTPVALLWDRILSAVDIIASEK